MPLEFNQPITKLTTPALGVAGILWSMELPQNINLGSLLLQLSVTKSATGTSTKSVPAPKDAVSLVTMLVNGTPQRTRALDELFGAQGLNALDEKNNGGTVQYFQAGAAITAALNGITYGAQPVLIGSAADVAIQAALANNTATTAVFALPFIFAEDYRKSYTAAAGGALPTGVSADGKTVTGNIGGVVFQFTMQPVTGVAGTFSAAVISANVEYDNALFVPTAIQPQVRLAKDKRLFKQYTASGDIEVADQIQNKAGEMLQMVSLVTPSPDTITKVVVKQGNQIIRTLTAADNLLSLRKCGINVDASPVTRFDIVFDRSDDPRTGLLLDPNAELSIVATLSTGGSGTITILPRIYGPVE